MFYRDETGIEHAAYVKAINRYHAYGLALAKFRKCEWARVQGGEIKKLIVEIMDSRWQRMVVTAAQFESWLSAKPKVGAPDEREKTYILMLLGRIPPDRDFKRGLQMR